MKPFAARLVAWHRSHGRRDLPWQKTPDAYRVWISEIMLQQTQVASVIPYYLRFVSEFPDVRALAAAPIDHVLQLWSGLGYYRRAHLLHRAAHTLVAKHAGVMPRDPKALVALPGIGRSTAAAIAVFAYGTRAAILDGNVKRVLARHADIAGYPGDARVERALWKRAEEALPESDIAVYTQALMDLGATVCVRTAPRCPACPIRTDCRGWRGGRVDQLPSPRPKKALPQRKLKVLVIEQKGEVLLERRPPSGVWAGLWSLPELETAADAAHYCHKRFGALIKPLVPLREIEHVFTHFRLTITPQRCIVQRWPAQASEPGLIWLPLADVAGAALPAPIKKLLRSLET
jgi:A/G-specific adenine glycosylase